MKEEITDLPSVMDDDWFITAEEELEMENLLAELDEKPLRYVTSVHFHLDAHTLLTAGLDGRVHLFQIDGERNTKTQTISLRDCPVRKASFLPDGSQVIISGRTNFFYTFDLGKAAARPHKITLLVPGGEERRFGCFEISPDSSTITFVTSGGYILLVSTKTKKLIGTLRVDGTIRSLSFTNCGQQLLSRGGDGQVYLWDLRTRTCIRKGADEGCINGITLCVSPNGSMFAAGSDSCIVNIYNPKEFVEGYTRSMKTIENLTTSKVDFMKFNNDAQLLAVCSTTERDSLKLVHVPSFTVFSNWPPATSTMGYPQCLDFSLGHRLMAVENGHGKVWLYKLHDYHQHA